MEAANDLKGEAFKSVVWTLSFKKKVAVECKMKLLQVKEKKKRRHQEILKTSFHLHSVGK